MTVHTKNHQRARSCYWLKKDLYQSHFLTVHITPPTAGPSSSNSSTKYIWINDSVSYFIYFLFILFLIFILFVCVCIFQITATCETYWCYLMFSWMCLYHFCYFNKKKAFNFVINIFIQIIYLNKLNCVYLFYLIIINILLYLGYIYFIFAFVYISPFFVTCKVVIVLNYVFLKEMAVLPPVPTGEEKRSFLIIIIIIIIMPDLTWYGNTRLSRPILT